MSQDSKNDRRDKKNVPPIDTIVDIYGFGIAPGVAPQTVSPLAFISLPLSFGVWFGVWFLNYPKNRPNFQPQLLFYLGFLLYSGLLPQSRLPLP